MSATAGLGALFAKKKKKVKSLNMTAKMKEEAKVEEAHEETTEEHGLEDNFTAIVSGAEPLVKTETKIVETDLATKEEGEKEEAKPVEQAEPAESTETKKGWGKTAADVAAEVEEQEKEHVKEEAERAAAKKAEEEAKPKVYVPAHLRKMREQKKAEEEKERIRDEGLTPAQMMELERKKKAQQEAGEKAKKQAAAAAASAADEEKKRQEREEAQRRKAELKAQVKKTMAAEESSKQTTPQPTASKADGSASYDQLIAKYKCRERRPVRPHGELDPCFLPPLQGAAAGAVGPEIFRTWIEADAGEASGCIVQFSPFTLHVAGRYLDSISAVVLIRSGDTCHDASADGTTRFLSRPGKCSPEVPGGYHNSTGVFKILCSVSAHNPGTGKACFSNDSGQTFTLAPSGSLAVTIIQYDTFAVADGLVPPAKRFIGRAHVNALAARPDGIVIGGHSDGYVRFWDGASGTEEWSSRATLDGAPITGIASRGDLMAVSSAHGRASVWNITNATASEYSVLRVDNEPSSFNTIAFSSNTTDIIAVGNDLGRVFIFRLSPVLSPVVAVAQIGEPVSVLRWCGGGVSMVVGTLAGSVSWWSLSDLSEPSAAIDDLCGYGGVADLQCASLGSGDSYVFAACTSGTVAVLRLDQSLSPVISNVWSLPNGRGGHEPLPVALAISPGGSEWLAVRTMDSIFIYDTNETLSSHLHPAFWDVLDGTRLLSEGSFSWFVVETGPTGNAPFVEVDSAAGSATFYPCWPLPDANRRRLENISDLTCVSPSAAPTVALDVTLPWEFVGVRGSYTVSSVGAIPADDCTSGQLPITDWAASPGGEWSLVRAFANAVGSDCIPLEGGSSIAANSMTTLGQCLNLCASLGLSGHQTCNVVNALPRPGATGLDRLVTVCDLRHCDDVTALQLQATTGGSEDGLDGQAFEVWALHTGTAYGGGYTAFGTPAQVLYGGCSVPGGKIPHGHDGGATVVIPETSLRSRPSNTLRFQVAQSNAEERVMISSIRLELLRQRPQPVRVIREPLLSSSGDSEVDANSRTGREVSGASSRGAVAWGQGQPEGAISPWLFTTSWDLSVAAFDLRGLYLQEVPFDGEPRHMWWKSGPGMGGEYRRNMAPQRPSSVYVVGVGLGQTSTIRISQVPYCGAPGSRYHHNAVYVPDAVPVVSAPNSTIQGASNLTVLEWRDVSISMLGEYKVCWCASSCCALQDALWSGGLAGLLVVSGPDHDRNYHVCRWGYTCVISNYVGHGLSQGDRIRLSAFAGAVECTPSLSSIGFWPPADPAIMATRTPGGSEYRTEFFHGDGVWRDFPVLDTSRTGITIMLCWCRAGDGCSGSPNDYKTPGGILTLTRFASDPARPLRCEQHSKCVVYMAADSRPLDPGDKLMIKHLPTDPVPSGVDPCTVSPGVLEGIGSSGRSDGCRAPDHSPQCLAFDFGIVDAGNGVPAGNYLVCWCQGSLRPCIDDFEFSTSVSETETLAISPAQYVFPEQCAVVFLEWRAPWIGYHDCCCNFKEVGSSPGCEDPDSEASRICNDDTHYQ
ncbi:hypothetical protein FOZ61_000132 [Perkinsus olseni]|uniref:Uncharacterized protein n=1 Tax=Perkinsus olseni TaxID=32597 RepID=A0A7J6MJ43_PEROL|nr:hypothetical protein FOZ61_000132 [Perkinsus olseni]KAF4671618.1 hypothetical protein FOL46_000163 [Perkinsus olseni]